MSRALAIAALAFLFASCGDSGAPTRLDGIRANAAKERSREIWPLPSVRRPEDLRYTGERRPDPFYPPS